jgi:hypothetical protein
LHLAGAALTVLAGVSGAAAASIPPHLRFQTVSTDTVSVHFHQGLEAMGREAAALATEILAAHEERYGHKVGRVHVVLLDASDDPNAFATPLPFPLVVVRAVAPDGSDDFGNHDGWLRLVLAHELTHTVHLDEARGLIGFGRKVLGRAPYLFPNALAMSWMIEGLATYEETEATAFGRGRNPDSRAVLRMAALEGRFPVEGKAIYALDAWPGGQTPYLFGEGFVRWMSEREGADVLPRLGRQHAGQIIPFLDDRTSGKVTGKSFHSHWKAWAVEATAGFEREEEKRRAQGITESCALTRRGIRQHGPRFSPDGRWIAYTSRTLTRFPEIRLVRPDASEDRALVLRNGGESLSWTPDGRAIVFSEAQVHRTFSVFNDLSLVDVETGRTRRLTRGLRAYDPAVSPDGKTVVFARKMGDRSELHLIGLDGSGLRALTASEPGTEWSSPHWRPQGDSIVAARLLPGGWLDLVAVDPATGAVQALTEDRAKDVEPDWTPDGEAVVFRSDRDGVSNLYELRLADRSLRRLTNVLGGAFGPSVSSDGTSMAFSAYTSRGFDIHLMPLEAGSALAAEGWADSYPPSRPHPDPVSAPARPYRPWSTLGPRFWTPWVSFGDEQERLGVVTGGSDALFRHFWGAQALYGLKTDRVDWSAFYVYDRFRPALLATAEDETSPVSVLSADGTEPSTVEVRTRRVNLQASLPLRRTIRSVQTLSVTWRREREEILGGGEADRLDLGGIQTAWTLSTARSYPYSISPIDGGRLRLAWLREAPGLGSDVSLDKLTADARYYLRLFGERDVLALRAGGGLTRGEPQFTRSFAVGGYPDASLFDVVRTNLAVLRGYPDNAFTGRSYAATNVEYRFPLVSPQWGWRSLPVFLRHMRGTLFFDAAHAWSDDFRLEDVKTSAGASIGFDTAVAFALPVTAELTLARGFAGSGETKAYFRFGLAF